MEIDVRRAQTGEQLDAVNAYLQRDSPGIAEKRRICVIIVSDKRNAGRSTAKSEQAELVILQFEERKPDFGVQLFWMSNRSLSFEDSLDFGA